MRKIINGKMYNTETASEIDSWWNGKSVRDFGYCKETLYKKKTGEFFLYGEGGAATAYRSKWGDMWGDGTKIIPMTDAETREWVECKLDAEVYIELFGEPEE